MNKIEGRELSNIFFKFCKKRTCEIIILAFFILFAFVFNNYTVVGDGISHYFILESLVLDRDLDITNQIEKYPDKDTPGSVSSVPFGVALFNAPFYIFSLALDNIPLFQKEFPRDENRGVLNININTASINLASNFYTILTLMLAILILRNLRLEASFSIIIACLVSTPLLYYSVLVSSLNHAVDTFLVTLFVYSFVKLREKPPKYQFILGALIALAAIVRYFNIIFFPMLFIYYLCLKKRENLKFLVAGFIPFILPLVWYALRENAYLLRLIPQHITRQRGSFYEPASFELYPRYFLTILFSPAHGLFLWSPVTILSSIGLYHFYKEKRETSLFFIGLFFSLVFAYSFFSGWHGGWSFSIRHLTCLFPVFVVGLSCFISKYRKWSLILTALFTAYSFFLMFNHFFDVVHGMMGTPWDMVMSWTSGEMTMKKFLFNVYRISTIDNILKFF